jgi:hypothetical protein
MAITSKKSAGREIVESRLLGYSKRKNLHCRHDKRFTEAGMHFKGDVYKETRSRALYCSYKIAFHFRKRNTSNGFCYGR